MPTLVSGTMLYKVPLASVGIFFASLYLSIEAAVLSTVYQNCITSVSGVSKCIGCIGRYSTTQGLRF